MTPKSEALNPESKGGLGYDDIDLFGRLRSLTIIKGLDLPTKVKPQTLNPEYDDSPSSMTLTSPQMLALEHMKIHDLATDPKPSTLNLKP